MHKQIYGVELRKKLEDKEYFINYINNAKSFASLCKLLRAEPSNSKIVELLINLTSFLNDINPIYEYRLHSIKLNLHDIPKCPVCGNPLSLQQLKKLYKQNIHVIPTCCSHKCYIQLQKNNEETHRKQSLLLKQRWANMSSEDKENFYKKIANTNIAKYGTKCTLNTEENIQKKKNTWIKKYGVDNPLKNKEVLKKLQETNLQKYNHVCAMDGNNTYKKIQTWKEKYGVEWCSQNSEVIKKALYTKYTKYGSKQKYDELSWQKYVITMEDNKEKYKHYKKYRIYHLNELNKDIIVQGYEGEALDTYLLKKYKEEDIENSIKFMNAFNFKYEYEGQLHRYIPDFYIKSEKLFIEVKSKYTLLLNPIKNFAKFKSIIDRGYNINIIIIDKPKKNEIKYKIYTYENIKAYIESIKG